MKHILAALLLLFAFASNALALPEATPSSSASAPKASPPTVNGVKLDLINRLEADKYLTGAQATEVKGKYIVSDAEIATADSSSWTKWLSIANIVKVIGVLFLLIAFHGLLIKLAKGIWWLVVLVPPYIYQAVVLSFTVFCTVWPAAIWESQSFYIALFSAFANIAVLSWILTVYPAVARFIKAMFSLGIPPYVLASLYGMLYFGVLAITYSSQVFGFFAAVCLSSAFGFGLFYMPGVLFLDIKKNALGVLMISHTVILIGYVALKTQGVPYLPLFAAGLEYYCSIGLGLAMLIAASPFYREHREVNVIFVSIIFCLAMLGYGYFGVHSIGAIIGIFTALLLIEWVLYLGFQGGLIFGAFVTGGILYGGGLFLESFGKGIMQQLGMH